MVVVALVVVAAVAVVVVVVVFVGVVVTVAGVFFDVRLLTLVYMVRRQWSALSSVLRTSRLHHAVSL